MKILFLKSFSHGTLSFAAGDTTEVKLVETYSDTAEVIFWDNTKCEVSHDSYVRIADPDMHSSKATILFAKGGAQGSHTLGVMSDSLGLDEVITINIGPKAKKHIKKIISNISAFADKGTYIAWLEFDSRLRVCVPIRCSMDVYQKMKGYCTGVKNTLALYE